MVIVPSYSYSYLIYPLHSSQAFNEMNLILTKYSFSKLPLISRIFFYSSLNYQFKGIETGVGKSTISLGDPWQELMLALDPSFIVQ